MMKESLKSLRWRDDGSLRFAWALKGFCVETSSKNSSCYCRTMDG